MHEDLLNAVSSLVHRHVLVTLHAMTGELLDRLSQNGGTAEMAKPELPELPESERLRPTEQNAAAWLELRTAFHAEIKRLHTTRSEVAAQLGVSKGAVCSWLAPNAGKPQNGDNIAAIRNWLSGSAEAEAPAEAEVPTPAPEDSLAAFRLSAAERDRLRGYISVQSEIELRALFGMTRPLLEKAVVSERLDAAVIERLRSALAGNGAAAE